MCALCPEDVTTVSRQRVLQATRSLKVFALLVRQTNEWPLREFLGEEDSKSRRRYDSDGRPAAATVA